MATLKSLMVITAIFAGGISLAMAQNPPTGGQPPVAGGAAGNAAVPEPSGATSPQPTKHHKKHHKKHQKSSY